MVLNKKKQERLFPLGRIVATSAALEELDAVGVRPITLLARHVTGDWGDLGKQDKESNDIGVKNGFRILSMYAIRGKRFYVITEWDRSVTTILLPEEY